MDVNGRIVYIHSTAAKCDPSACGAVGVLGLNREDTTHHTPADCQTL